MKVLICLAALFVVVYGSGYGSLRLHPWRCPNSLCHGIHNGMTEYIDPNTYQPNPDYMVFCVKGIAHCIKAGYPLFTTRRPSYQHHQSNNGYGQENRYESHSQYEQSQNQYNDQSHNQYEQNQNQYNDQSHNQYEQNQNQYNDQSHNQYEQSQNQYDDHSQNQYDRSHEDRY